MEQAVVTILVKDDFKSVLSYPLPFDKNINNFNDLGIGGVLVVVDDEIQYNQIGMSEGCVSISKRDSWYLEIYDKKLDDLSSGEHSVSLKLFDKDRNILIDDTTNLAIYEDDDTRDSDATPADLLKSENYTAKEVRNERYAICKDCPQLFKPTRTCKECGCFMSVKTWLKNAECPIGRWGRVDE